MDRQQKKEVLPKQKNEAYNEAVPIFLRNFPACYTIHITSKFLRQFKKFDEMSKRALPQNRNIAKITIIIQK